MISRGIRWALVFAVSSQAAVLGTAAWDRVGSEGTLLRLTDREAQPFPHPSSASSLTLAWGEAAPGGEPLFDVKLLAALGFDCTLKPSAPGASRHYASVLPRRVWVVLEQEGDAWHEWLARAEMELRARGERVARGEMTRAELDEAAARLEGDRRSRPRLLVVDAGTSTAELRLRWPDRRRHALASAVVRPRLRPSEAGPLLAGEVVRLLPSRLALPPAEARRLMELAGSATVEGGVPRAPRYEVEVRFGRLGRPRIVRVLPL